MVGVLALQGNYQMHANMLTGLNVETVFVKKTSDLLKCSSLIIPGGESTVISKLMVKYNLFDSVKDFSINHGIFGTCAGLIMMAKNTLKEVRTLNVIDAEVLRNAWGRQIDSFTANIEVDFDEVHDFKATFIRAPKIMNISKTVKLLGSINSEPVIIQEGKHLATTFHPEMHGDTLIHKYFLKMVGEID